jgi:hypothetical protein
MSAAGVSATTFSMRERMMGKTYTIQASYYRRLNVKEIAVTWRAAE